MHSTTASINLGRTLTADSSALHAQLLNAECDESRLLLFTRGVVQHYGATTTTIFMCIEFAQYLAFALHPHHAGRHVMWSAVYISQLPVWDGTFISGALGYAGFLLVYWVVAAFVIAILLLCLMAMRHPYWVANKVMRRGCGHLVSLLASVLLIPSINIMLSAFVCRKATSPSSLGAAANVARQPLVEHVLLFPGESCSSALVRVHTLISAVLLVLWVATAYIITVTTFAVGREDAAVGRHMNPVVDRVTFLYKLFLCCSFFVSLAYDAEVAQALAVAVSSYVVAGATAVYLPYYAERVNRLAVVAYTVIGWNATIIAAAAHINRQIFLFHYPLYTILALSSVGAGSLAYVLAGRRYSRSTRQLLAHCRSAHPTSLAASPFALALLQNDLNLLPFPSGLPSTDVRFSPLANTAVDILREGRQQELRTAQTAAMEAKGGDGNTTEDLSLSESVVEGARTSGSAAGGEGLEGYTEQALVDEAKRNQVVSPTISTAWLPSDAEVSLRFLHEWHVLTGTPPTPFMLYFACRTLNRFLLRYPHSALVHIVYASFLCDHAASTTRLTLCLELLRAAVRQRRVTLAEIFLVDYFSQSVKEQLGIHDGVDHISVLKARALHREILIHSTLVWRSLLEEHHNLSFLYYFTNELAVRKHRCLQLYLEALQCVPDNAVVLRSAGNFVASAYGFRTAVAVCMEAADIAAHLHQLQLRQMQLDLQSPVMPLSASAAAVAATTSSRLDVERSDEGIGEDTEAAHTSRSSSLQGSFSSDPTSAYAASSSSRSMSSVAALFAHHKKIARFVTSLSAQSKTRHRKELAMVLLERIHHTIWRSYKDLGVHLHMNMFRVICCVGLAIIACVVLANGVVLLSMLDQWQLYRRMIEDLTHVRTLVNLLTYQIFRTTYLLPTTAAEELSAAHSLELQGNVTFLRSIIEATEATHNELIYGRSRPLQRALIDDFNAPHSFFRFYFTVNRYQEVRGSFVSQVPALLATARRLADTLAAQPPRSVLVNSVDIVMLTENVRAALSPALDQLMASVLRAVSDYAVTSIVVYLLVAVASTVLIGYALYLLLWNYYRAASVMSSELQLFHLIPFESVQRLAGDAQLALERFLVASRCEDIAAEKHASVISTTAGVPEEWRAFHISNSGTSSATAARISSDSVQSRQPYTETRLDASEETAADPSSASGQTLTTLHGSFLSEVQLGEGPEAASRAAAPPAVDVQRTRTSVEGPHAMLPPDYSMQSSVSSTASNTFVLLNLYRCHSADVDAATAQRSVAERAQEWNADTSVLTASYTSHLPELAQAAPHDTREPQQPMHGDSDTTSYRLRPLLLPLLLTIAFTMLGLGSLVASIFAARHLLSTTERIERGCACSKRVANATFALYYYSMRYVSGEHYDDYVVSREAFLSDARVFRQCRDAVNSTYFFNARVNMLKGAVIAVALTAKNKIELGGRPLITSAFAMVAKASWSPLPKTVAFASLVAPYLTSEELLRWAPYTSSTVDLALPPTERRELALNVLFGPFGMAGLESLVGEYESMLIDVRDLYQEQLAAAVGHVRTPIYAAVLCMGLAILAAGCVLLAARGLRNTRRLTACFIVVSGGAFMAGVATLCYLEHYGAQRAQLLDEFASSDAHLWEVMRVVAYASSYIFVGSDRSALELLRMSTTTYIKKLGRDVLQAPRVAPRGMPLDVGRDMLAAQGSFLHYMWLSVVCAVYGRGNASFARHHPAITSARWDMREDAVYHTYARLHPSEPRFTNFADDVVRSTPRDTLALAQGTMASHFMRHMTETVLVKQGKANELAMDTAETAVHATQAKFSQMHWVANGLTFAAAVVLTSVMALTAFKSVCRFCRTVAQRMVYRASMEREAFKICIGVGAILAVLAVTYALSIAFAVRARDLLFTAEGMLRVQWTITSYIAAAVNLGFCSTYLRYMFIRHDLQLRLGTFNEQLRTALAGTRVVRDLRANLNPRLFGSATSPPADACDQRLGVLGSAICVDPTDPRQGNQNPLLVQLAVVVDLLQTVAELPADVSRDATALSAPLRDIFSRTGSLEYGFYLAANTTQRDVQGSLKGHVSATLGLLLLAGCVIVLIHFMCLRPTVRRTRQQRIGAKVLLSNLPIEVQHAVPEIKSFYDPETSSAMDQIRRKLQQSEQLLQNILPPNIARRLKNGERVIADDHESVTAAFVHLVGVEEYSHRLNAREQVLFLNGLVVAFDRIIDQLDLEKVKTIGDLYFFCGGLTKKTERDHALRCMECALLFFEALEDHKSRHSTPNITLQIGINTAPAVAGVIGNKKIAYDLWGDCVNTASRMYSTGIPGRIQVTEATYEELSSYYQFEDRYVQAKGKGTLLTHLYVSRLRNTPYTNVNWRVTH